MDQIEVATYEEPYNDILMNVGGHYASTRVYRQGQDVRFGVFNINLKYFALREKSRQWT